MQLESEKPLISVIIATYNAEKFLKDAIQSVINQRYTNLEIIVVDDGSVDSTGTIVAAMHDPRINYIVQENKGVSVARNVGMAVARGVYFCFLDADDEMPPNSIYARYEVFVKNPELAFVGGAQEQWDVRMTTKLKTQIPAYWGPPLTGLLNLDASCFINCGTWLIKRDAETHYSFPEGWTHCEDLMFFLSISSQGILGFTQETVQYYRRSDTSAMGNLVGLARGYIQYYKFIASNYGLSVWHKLKIKLKLARIIGASFLAQNHLGASFVFSLKIICA